MKRIYNWLHLLVNGQWEIAADNHKQIKKTCHRNTVVLSNFICDSDPVHSDVRASVMLINRFAFIQSPHDKRHTIRILYIIIIIVFDSLQSARIAACCIDVAYRNVLDQFRRLICQIGGEWCVCVWVFVSCFVLFGYSLHLVFVWATHEPYSYCLSISHYLYSLLYFN